MAAATAFPVAHVVLYAVIAVMPIVLFWAVERLPRVVRRLRRRHVPPPVPHGPPVQRLAADLRRLHRQLEQASPGGPAARRYGMRQAYDALLAQACAAVGVEHHLDALPEGLDKHLERVRVEGMLRETGLSVP